MATQRNGLSARERLLDSAETLFFHEGIANTGVDDVLEHSGISVATLYSHFGSKDGLIRATLERRFATWQSVWDEAVGAASTDETRLLAVFDALELFRQRHRAARWCAFLSTATELSDPDSSVHSPIEADTALLVKRLHQLAIPLAGERAADLAEDILLIYNGTLAAFLRGYPSDPIGHGRRLATTVIRAVADRVEE
jgi:AcrR family transcriptional regulator